MVDNLKTVQQAPAVYRRRIGALMVTIISDGYLETDPAFFSGGAELLGTLTDAAFLPRGPFRPRQFRLISATPFLKSEKG